MHAELDRKDGIYAFFNLLTSPELLDRVKAILPEHRERVFPPTETLSMFLSHQTAAAGGDACHAGA